MAFLALTLFLGATGIQVQASEKVNLNTATLEELQELPGVGEVIAQRIIDYRSENPFENVEEIIEINGVGETRYNKIKDLITI
jgi:competence protein ComEA